MGDATEWSDNTQDDVPLFPVTPTASESPSPPTIISRGMLNGARVSPNPIPLNLLNTAADPDIHERQIQPEELDSPSSPQRAPPLQVSPITDPRLLPHVIVTDPWTFEPLPTELRFPCRDWIIMSCSCHYARDYFSFTTYHPIEILAYDGTGMIHLVRGVGTVHLTFDEGFPSYMRWTTTLENVLHIPTALCNVFNPIPYGFTAEPRFNTRRMWNDQTGTIRFRTKELFGLEQLMLPRHRTGEKHTSSPISIVGEHEKYRDIIPKLVKMFVDLNNTESLRDQRSLEVEQVVNTIIPMEVLGDPEISYNCFPWGH
ncbi:hypothetical protein EG329_010120 [Mollisiaceae sp. DMI_Dod_QoI]|nr:hypothetical protein EG329_010120 [Helotiales sp. DMI_Dod_QoI]